MALEMTLTPVAQQVTIAVSLGEIKASADPGSVLACFGLGSCVAISAWDPDTRSGVMAHVVLPSSDGEASLTAPAKFANQAVPLLVRLAERHGAAKNRLIIKLAGGANIIRCFTAVNGLDIGGRNVIAVKEALSSEGIKVTSHDLGGNSGRSLWLFPEDGRTLVRNGSTNKITPL
jgi:chemotaxis protein CheD